MSPLQLSRRRFISAAILSILSHTAGALPLPIRVPDPEVGPARVEGRVEHAKLLRLLGACQAIEITLRDQSTHLIADYGDVEPATLYQDLNLSTAAGIQVARQRIIAFTAKYDGFADAQARQWVDIEALVVDTDLDEPWATELRANFAADKANTFSNYRAWFEAARNDAAAVTHLLDVAQQDLGHTYWNNGRLNSNDQRASAELQRIKSTVLDAENRFNIAGRAALDSVDHTLGFIRSALLQLEAEERQVSQ